MQLALIVFDQFLSVLFTIMYLVRFFFIFDEVYEDFQSNLPLDANRHKS
jgi:hypothetical protein